MNLVLVEAGELSANRVRLSGRRAQHLRHVRKVEIGTQLPIGVLDGGTGQATVVDLQEDDVELEVKIDGVPPPPLPLTLLLALPRPKVMRRVLQGLAAIGAKRIVLMNCWRVEKSYWQSPYLAPDSLREQLILGLEQGRDTILPRVELRPRFKPFVEDELEALAAGTLALVAHPEAAEPCPRGSARSVTLAIGPEGGFSPYEVELLQSAGFNAVHLGPRPLRVEQIIPAIVGRLF